MCGNNKQPLPFETRREINDEMNVANVVDKDAMAFLDMDFNNDKVDVNDNKVDVKDGKVDVKDNKVDVNNDKPKQVADVESVNKCKRDDSRNWPGLSSQPGMEPRHSAFNQVPLSHHSGHMPPMTMRSNNNVTIHPRFPANGGSFNYFAGMQGPVLMYPQPPVMPFCGSYNSPSMLQLPVVPQASNRWMGVQRTKRPKAQQQICCSKFAKWTNKPNRNGWPPLDKNCMSKST
ncbi:hypothetical protein ACA910_011039 [Epithemia clementina (nom. ined.)]